MSRMILFCLPYAGGTAMIYSSWRSRLHSSILLRPVELPGRGKRFREANCDRLEEAVEDIYSRIAPDLAGPFALFGHSMGSLLAFELAIKIKQRTGLEPAQLIVSGRRAPHVKVESPKIHALPDDQFKEEIRMLGGTPDEILRDEDMFDVFLPALRADFKMIEEYCYPTERSEKLDCGVHVLTGRGDAIKEEHLAAWGELTTGTCFVTRFEGGHFFIHDHEKAIVDLINNELMKPLIRSSV
ncbi:thioesterase [Paenibacillus dendritiformis]|uniref:thioesterase II family protein n=1 Tax=Paenibacillus dendritiformis TaxID=130049 RepID=UPI00143D0B36|nr:alpha/beta fold hydrolase [Paenibacillus dendritiformis]NKI19663.1 thioesterase [Paenibacillus dendritiformis]NRF96378.1 thioesterase [Paenibacillus dendritiformis]